MTLPMNPGERNPASPDAAADAAEATPASNAEPEPDTRPKSEAPAAEPEQAEAESPWLASAEGLVPVVPRAHDQWTPEPEPDPDLDLNATRLQPPPVTAQDDWGWRPATEAAPTPALAPPAAPVARSSASR